MQRFKTVDGTRGVLIAAAVIGLWLASQVFLLSVDLHSMFWLIPLLVIWQTHLYTGMFITAHDAMHGTVSPNKKINNAIGSVAAGLFAFNFFPRLLSRHHRHHKNVATELDPDYHGSHKFWPWYFSFLKNYITWWQLLLMAVTFNVLKIWIDPVNVIGLWMVPSVLSTLQLFYFGTYVPHKGEFASTNPHHASTLPRNHVVAFIACYFFGYHYEHHEFPYVPWWKLPQLKDQLSTVPSGKM
jgi:beta-carotene/zeaxanthin 4-ketolase